MTDLNKNFPEQLFQQAQNLDTAAVNLLFDELWKILNQSQGESIAELLNVIKEWAITNAPMSRFSALAEFTLGYAAFFAAQYSRSTIHSLQAIESFKELGDNDGMALSNVVLGNSYRSMGANELAIQCYLRARLNKNIAYPLADLGSSYQLAEVYVEMGNYQEALPLLEQALQLVRRNNFAAWWEPRIINSKAHTLVRLGETGKGLAAFKAARRISKREGFSQVTARVLTDMAEYYQMAGDLDRAIRHNKQALNIREQLNISNASITNLLNLAAIYDQQGNHKQELKCLEKALPLATGLGMKAKLARIHELFSLVFERNGNITQSLEHYKAFHRVTEEASLEDAGRKIQNYKQIIEAEQTSRENILIRQQKMEIEEKNIQLNQTVDELILARDLIRREKERSDELLLNILPADVADELKEKGSASARLFDEVTVLFTDFVNFTTLSELLDPQELVNELHECFKAFDAIIEKHHIEKIKTIGDAYLAVSGLPNAEENHAVNAVKAALDIRQFIYARKQTMGDRTFNVRIGVHSGSVVAGIVGVKKFAYDIWGDTVNTAARMEQNSEPGKINVSEKTYAMVKDQFDFTCRGEIAAKNKGKMKMYFAESAIAL